MSDQRQVAPDRPAQDDDRTTGQTQEERAVAAASGTMEAPHSYTVASGEWEDLPDAVEDDLMVINMGPQHPPPPGELRQERTLDRQPHLHNTPLLGHLHPRTANNLHYPPSVQGVTSVTPSDYLSPSFNEQGYCLAVERLLLI
jgi:NADH-quinone oxidoreductase subunit D